MTKWDRYAMLLAVCVLHASVSAAQDTLVEIPDEELLEFLASWETDDGDWIDPFTFTEDEPEVNDDEKLVRGGTPESSDETED